MPSPNHGANQPAAPAKKPRKKRGMMDVITGHKLVIYSIVGNLCALPFVVGSNAFLGGTTEASPLSVIVLAIGLLVLLAAKITAAIGILRMGVVLFPDTRFLYAIGVLLPVPVIGLILMINTNVSARKYLRERGVTVGLFGAKR